nr:hypothetical protein [Tanacetum cinerariifolium]
SQPAFPLKKYRSVLIKSGKRGRALDFKIQEEETAKGYSGIALGLCLNLPCAKSKGLVRMEIPLGLILRLITNWDLAWYKLKIGE